MDGPSWANSMQDPPCAWHALKMFVFGRNDIAIYATYSTLFAALDETGKRKHYLSLSCKPSEGTKQHTLHTTTPTKRWLSNGTEIYPRV